MLFDSAKREITFKIVYYGPPSSGKTANLQALHELLGSNLAGNLTVLNAGVDQTLFFDMLPITLMVGNGYSVQLKLFSVPGHAIHAATRRVVLTGADAVVFVADSQVSMTKVNAEYWHGMRRYLKENGVDPAALPTALQFNKRDLPDVRSDDELRVVARQGTEPVFKTVAIRGEGVVETLRGVLEVLFSMVNSRYDFARKFKIDLKSLLNTVSTGATTLA